MSLIDWLAFWGLDESGELGFFDRRIKRSVDRISIAERSHQWPLFALALEPRASEMGDESAKV